MARTTVPVTRTSRYVAFTSTPTAGDTVNGMQMVNDGSTVILVESASGAAQTVDFLLVETVDFQTAGPVVVAVSASEPGSVLGPFPTNLYGSVLEFDVSSASLSMSAFTLA
jgi:hypothetical protein